MARTTSRPRQLSRRARRRHATTPPRSGSRRPSLNHESRARRWNLRRSEPRRLEQVLTSWETTTRAGNRPWSLGSCAQRRTERWACGHGSRARVRRRTPSRELGRDATPGSSRRGRTRQPSRARRYGRTDGHLGQRPGARDEESRSQGVTAMGEAPAGLGDWRSAGWRAPWLGGAAGRSAQGAVGARHAAWEKGARRWDQSTRSRDGGRNHSAEAGAKLDQPWRAGRGRSPSQGEAGGARKRGSWAWLPGSRGARRGRGDGRRMGNGSSKPSSTTWVRRTEVEDELIKIRNQSVRGKNEDGKLNG
jgi:hypothetical protein